MRVGIIGAGVQARAAHLPTFYKLEGVEVAAIADINEKSAKTLADKYGVPQVYTDYHDLLENPDIDLVSICTPSGLHKEMALESARAGKHILIEKPLAVSVKDADEILSEVDRGGIKLCVVQNYRFFPAVKKARRRIEEGRVGDIVSIHGYGHLLQSFDRPWSLDEKTYGVLEDFGPHLIDIILYLNSFKAVRRVYAEGGNFGGHLDLIVRTNILMDFENDVTASVDLSWVAGAKEVALYVQGTGGLLHIDIRNNNLRETHQYSTPVDDITSMVGRLKTVGRGAVNGSYFQGAKTYYAELIENFIRSIEEDTTPPVTGEEARKTALVIESAYKSMREKRPVSIT